MLQITNWIISLFIIFSMTVTCLMVNRIIFWIFPTEIDSDRRKSPIDGLRGFLSVFVFIHHFLVWYFYISRGHWDIYDSNLYRNLGHTSVTIFFMITGFLFFKKINNKNKINWGKLYSSRVKRIVPLYAFVLSIVLIIVAIKTSFHLQVSTYNLISSVFHWVIFTFPSAPDINNYKGTSFIVAGVTWSLVYEWFFYLSLPIVSLLIKGRGNLPFLMMSITAFLIFMSSDLSKVHLISFAMGCIASLKICNEDIINALRSRTLSIIAIALIIIPAILLEDTQSEIAILISGVSFFIISSGNSLFGILNSRVCKMLGEVSYSIYMIHGIVLFLIMPSLANHKEIIMHPAVYALIGISLSAILMIVSNITYRVIEKRFY